MRNKNYSNEQNSNGIEVAFQKINKQKNDKVQNRQELLRQAHENIDRIIGKSKYIESIEIRRYTYDNAIDYIKEKYAANEITFAECLDYIPNKYHLLESCISAKDPVAYLTDGYILEQYLSAVLLLPALNDPDSKFATKKNGCILLLSKKEDVLDSWWMGGNKKGYTPLYNGELYILTNGKKAVLD